MKFCKKCKRLYIDTETCCSECKKVELSEVKDNNQLVLLCNCNAAQREMLISNLKSENIEACYQSQSEPNGMAMEGYNVFVPYKMYKEASEIAVTLGFMEQNQEICDNIELLDDTSESFEELSPAKRTTVRILSAIALIVLFSLTIFGVDYIMAIIKNLFT